MLLGFGSRDRPFELSAPKGATRELFSGGKQMFADTSSPFPKNYSHAFKRKRTLIQNPDAKRPYNFFLLFISTLAKRGAQMVCSSVEIEAILILLVSYTLFFLKYSLSNAETLPDLFQR